MNSQSIYSSHFREEPEEEESEPFYTGDEMPNDIRRLIHNVSTGQQRFADAELHLRSQLHAAEVEQSRCRDRLEEMMGHAFAADIWDSVSVSPVKLTEDERPLVRELARARVMVQRYNSYLEALLQQFGDDTRVIALSDRVLELEEQVRVLKHQSKELAQWRLKARSPRAWLGECKRQEEERHLMAAKSQRTEEEHKVCHEVQQAQGPLSATAVQEFEATSEPSVWEMEQRAHRRGHRSLSEGFHRPANSNAFSDTAGDSLWSRGASSFTPSSSDNRNETANGGGGGGGSFGAASSPSPRASMESKAVSTADEGQGAVQQSPAGAREEAEAAGLQGKLWVGQHVTAKDCREVWCKAVVLEVDSDTEEAKLKFLGWSRQWDEWVPCTAEFIRLGMAGRFKVSRQAAFLSRGWGYSGAPDAITVQVDRPIMLLGVTVYGASVGTFASVASVFQGSSGTGHALATSPKVEFSKTSQVLMFSQAVRLSPGTAYTLSVATTGPQSLYGEGFKKQLEVAGVNFQFSHCTGPNNGSSSTVGQIPELFCSMEEL